MISGQLGMAQLGIAQLGADQNFVDSSGSSVTAVLQISQQTLQVVVLPDQFERAKRSKKKKGRLWLL